MKKIINVLFIMLLSLSLVGCGKEFYTEKDVSGALKHFYPNDKFEIISYETIEGDEKHSCEEHTNMNVWRIKSLTEDVDFEVYDYYKIEYDIYGNSCEHIIEDNYDEVIAEKLKISLKDLNEKDFGTRDELIDYFYENIMELKKHSPYKYNIQYCYSITLKKGGARVCSDVESREDVVKEINGR